MNDPYLLLAARSIYGFSSPDPEKAVWLDSIMDCCNPVWVESDEEEVRDLEQALSIGPFELAADDPVFFVNSEPFIWISDSFSETDHQWCDERNLVVPSLLIEVGEEGIQKKDVELAAAFLDYLDIS